MSVISRDVKLQAPSVTTAAVMIVLTFAAYVLFNYLRLGEDLYVWSKTLAPYDYRQHLGMSKRFLMQYGHILFLFSLFVFSKYVLVSDRATPRLSRWLDQVVPYTLPVFIIHFPFLYLFAAMREHDPGDPMDQLVLFALTLVASVAFGKLCFLTKPWFDRLQKYLVGLVRSSSPAEVPAYPPARMTRSFSDFLKAVRILATVSIFMGHFTFAQFASIGIPGFDHWRRWAVPFFFMTSGYFAMRSIEPKRMAPLAFVVNRYTSLWFMVVPMLFVVPFIDHIGFRLDPQLYYLHEKFVTPTEGGPTGVVEFFTTFVNSILYLNEIFLYDLLGVGTTYGGMRTFSNDTFWFLCYLMPFTAMLVIMLKMQGWRKYVALAAVILMVGPPVLFLAPLFFAGSLAYRIHQRM